MAPIVSPQGRKACRAVADQQAKKSAACATLRKYTSFGCWLMFEFFGVRVVSSALKMQILLCTE